MTPSPATPVTQHHLQPTSCPGPHSYHPPTPAQPQPQPAVQPDTQAGITSLATHPGVHPGQHAGSGDPSRGTSRVRSAQLPVPAVVPGTSIRSR